MLLFDEKRWLDTCFVNMGHPVITFAHYVHKYIDIEANKDFFFALFWNIIRIG